MIQNPEQAAEVVILASSSPRRQELLAQMGIPFEVIPPHLDEDMFEADDPDTLVAALAAAKAEVVRNSVAGSTKRWILSADTVVAVGRKHLGKPGNREDAGRMIRALSGRTHTVLTGIAVWPPQAEEPTVRVARTDVSFTRLTPKEIGNYLGTGDWRDVAGGYRIQGRAALYIDGISGSYSNVVGLPIHLVYSIFTQHGYTGLE